MILGDTNLDYMKWTTPDFHLKNMVDMVKNQVETLGFAQVVNGITRCWIGQTSSLLDQCWTNCGTRLASCRNLVRSSSDHNLVEIVIRLKGVNKTPKEIIKRNRNSFDPAEFKSRASQVDWSELLSNQNVDICYDTFETKIRELLDVTAPMKKV